MLMRFLSGLVGIPLLIILVFVNQGMPFVVGLGLISIIALWEFYSGVRRTGAEPQEWVGFACAFLFLYAARDEFRANLSMPAVLTFFVIATLTVELLQKNRSPIKNLGSTFLGVIYVGWLFSYLVAINSVGVKDGFRFAVVPVGMSVRCGAWLVLYIIFVVWASDTGAYLIGRKWGKHHLAPKLSPGKSWEGFAAGMASAMVMSLLMGLAVGAVWWHLVILAVGIGIAGLVGDLAESAMKRDLGIKDFGSILPGHGGALDRFDGLLFAAPLFYYYIKHFTHAFPIR
jgi:phosphatidate cytidylyltransferase